ncbi:hypothetical protein FHT44_004939 [Mycolicibacterium sp. BK634]|uniref:hypothetical protein n=1 Tax=Mycolicibacterium sp. BK634 TaxID=2587099 RepID=UPI00160C27C7|nr:hypothetical protein [Mycolicibacterium sp. BK634]MBB3752427.1 hypothetical protein [Mycolicibacterium sp. BK634]
MAEALIRVDGRGGLRRISPADRLHYLKMADAAIDVMTVEDVEPYLGKARIDA